MSTTQKAQRSFIEEAVLVLKNGGVVAAATETVFGLLADIRVEAAVRKIREIKGLDEHSPILLIAPSMKHVQELCLEMSPAALRLAERYWPGPLTLILKAGREVPLYIRGSHDTVAVRVPGECDAAQILRLFSKPLTATSCNPHGKVPAVTGGEALDMFGEKVDIVVPGTSPGGLPSTMVDTTVDPPVITRRGILNIEGQFLR